MFKRIFKGALDFFTCSELERATTLPMAVKNAPANDSLPAEVKAELKAINIARQAEEMQLTVEKAKPTGYQWKPGEEHSKHPAVKENADGSIYYKGKVYRPVERRPRRPAKAPA